MRQDMELLTSMKTTEWYTPPHIIFAVREVMGSIELDPASCAEANKIVQADRYFTKETDGLIQSWEAKTVFLNPPFNNTPKWVDKFLQESNDLNFLQGILLVNSAPGYKWWENLVDSTYICMLRNRLRFLREDGTADGQAKKGQTVAYIGPWPDRFRKVFNTYGRLI